MKKSIIIADHSEVIRKGLIHIIGNLNLFDFIHEAASAAILLTAVNKYNPDVMVINPLFITPELEGWLRENGSNGIKVVAFKYGIFDDHLQELFEEVIEVGDSRLKIKNKLKSLLKKEPGTTASYNDETLSEREKDVVKLLAKGLSNKEISEKLFISPHTVTTHRKNITRKLNIRSVAGLIVYAIIHGIVTVDDLEQPAG